MLRLFRHSLLWGILIPVVLIGIASSIVLSSLLTKPLTESLREKIDVTVLHAASMGLSACEERFSDLLDLRMENNPEMNAASKKESIEEIKRISNIFPNIRTIILDERGTVHGNFLDVKQTPTLELIEQLRLQAQDNKIFHFNLWGHPVVCSSQYFPFWRWQIVSYIPEDEYLAPIEMAKRIVSVGTFGTLLVVVVTVLFVFLWKVNKPLKNIINATDEVRRGLFTPLQIKGKDEIARVAVAFNDMVNSLAEDKDKLDSVMGDLSESEEQYRVLTENSLALICMLQNNSFIYSNEMMRRMLGYSSRQLGQLKIDELSRPSNLSRLRQRLMALESGVLDVDHFESGFISSSGKEIWLEILATPITYQGDRAILIHAIDITAKKHGQLEREELQDKLARIEKMEAVGTLAGGVAHDLNNILGGIVGYPELLLLDMSKDDPLYKPLNTIQASGLKASAIVQDMLTLTRRGVVVTEIINLNSIVSEYLQSPEYDKLASFHENIVVQTDLATDLMNIDGSPIHLAKTIMNLVTNAMEAMQKGGTISLSTENIYIDSPISNYETVIEGEYVTFTISDTGTGISKEDLEKIFEPFYTKKVMGRSGTGLGMSVVWGTVKDHNGYIEASSTEGEGSTFCLYFPSTRKSVSPEKVSFDHTTHATSGERILVVDDVEEQRIIASSILDKLGYSVHTVKSGEAAIEYLQNTSVDLVLLDMIMDPGIDGLDTYREILNLHPNQKALIASGYSETERLKKAQELGAGRFIKKPYIMATLALAVREVLNE